MKLFYVMSWLALLAQEPRCCQGAPLAHSHQGDLLGAALPSSVALLEGGAQRNFDLFYPQLPADNVKKEETSTSVPVIHLPFENEQDFEKVAADAILDMIPHELLENNKKVRPVDVKIIEHDGYIDYEIEFVELSEDYDYIYDYHEEDSDNESEATTEVSTSPDITFVDLLKKARNNHRQRLTDATEEVISSNLNTPEKVKERSQENSSPARQRKQPLDSGNKSPITNNLRSNTAVVRNSDNLDFGSKLGRSSTTPSNVIIQQQTEVSVTEESSTPTPQTTATATTTDLAQQQLNYNNNKDFPELPRSSQQEQNRAESDRDESSDEIFDDGYSTDQEYFLTSESKAELSVFTDNRQSERIPKVIRNKNDKSQQLEAESVESKTPSTGEILNGGYHEVDPGQYHEVNPGQYHEVNPGQYHEVNPGQYHEVNPGQYHEVNPGQYKLNEEDIKVSVDENRDRGSKTYDVAANVGDFIIGEVGRIDINSGQTLEGVRYTALESEVDYEKIKEILEMYFGARTS